MTVPSSTRSGARATWSAKPGPNIFRSTAFRLSLLYAGLFAAAAALAMGYVYWHTSVFHARQLDETIQAEIRGLAEQYRQGGLPRLVQIVAQRSASPGAGLYVIADDEGERIAGNLGSASPALLAASGRVQFPYRAASAGGSETRLAMGQVFRLDGGYRMMVGRDIEDRRKLNEIFASAFLWGIGLIALIGVLGGLLVSRVLLRRIGAMLSARHPGVALVPMLLPVVSAEGALRAARRLGIPLDQALYHDLERRGPEAGWETFATRLREIRESELFRGAALMASIDPSADYLARLRRIVVPGAGDRPGAATGS